jgi:hypothetical protein
MVDLVVGDTAEDVGEPRRPRRCGHLSSAVAAKRIGSAMPETQRAARNSRALGAIVQARDAGFLDGLRITLQAAEIIVPAVHREIAARATAPVVRVTAFQMVAAIQAARAVADDAGQRRERLWGGGHAGRIARSARHAEHLQNGVSSRARFHPQIRRQCPRDRARDGKATARL